MWQWATNISINLTKKRWIYNTTKSRDYNSLQNNMSLSRWMKYIQLTLSWLFSLGIRKSSLALMLKLVLFGNNRWTLLHICWYLLIFAGIFGLLGWALATLFLCRRVSFLIMSNIRPHASRDVKSYWCNSMTLNLGNNYSKLIITKSNQLHTFLNHQAGNAWRPYKQCPAQIPTNNVLLKMYRVKVSQLWEDNNEDVTQLAISRQWRGSNKDMWSGSTISVLERTNTTRQD